MASSRGSTLRVNGALLVLAGLLIAAGTKLPWISVDGLPFQWGLTPAVPEIWPVLAGAAAFVLLGLVALAYTDRMSSQSWPVALLVALGVAAFMFPRIHEINQGIIDSDGFLGIAQGMGIWAIGAGVIVGLLAGTSGWGSARNSAPSQGFTIIEAAVVILVIGTVLAVLVSPPAPLGTTQAASGFAVQPIGSMEPVPPGVVSFESADSNRAAQVELRDVLLAEKRYWLDHGDYTAEPADVIAFNPNLNLAASSRAGVVLTLSDTTSDRVCMTRTTDSGRSFSVWEDSSAGTFYGVSDLTASCPSAPPASYAQGGW